MTDNTSKDKPQPIDGGNDLPSYDAPPPRPEGSNIAGHAWDELNRAGAFTAEGAFQQRNNRRDTARSCKEPLSDGAS